MTPSDRGLFLKWALLNAVLLVFLIAAGVAYHSHFHGATLVAVPAILAIFGAGSAFGGVLTWRACDVRRGGRRASAILHDAHWLNRLAYVSQIAGIMSTMIGFYIVLQSADAGNLSTKLQGGSVALLGSFVGVLCSLVLLAEEWLLVHDLAPRD